MTPLPDPSARSSRGHRDRRGEWSAPIYVISVAAELADMHPQTLRQYDRLGLVVPQRQGGRQRRYSRQDVYQLRTIQRLSRDGVSLEGIRRIVQLEREVEQLQGTITELAGQIQAFHTHARYERVFTAGTAGDVTTTFGSRNRTQPDDGARARRTSPVRRWPAAALTAGTSPLGVAGRRSRRTADGQD